MSERSTESAPATNEGPSEGDASESKTRRPYEAPRLERVGSLRELLGKTGAVQDTGPPFSRKP